MKELIFSSCRLGIYSFTWVNLQVFFKDFGCILCWQLYRQPFSSWEVLLSIFCGTKITSELTTPQFLDLSPNMPYPPINLEIFQSAPSIIQYSEDSIPPICNRKVQTMSVFVRKCLTFVGNHLNFQPKAFYSISIFIFWVNPSITSEEIYKKWIFYSTSQKNKQNKLLKLLKNYH